MNTLNENAEKLRSIKASRLASLLHYRQMKELQEERRKLLGHKYFLNLLTNREIERPKNFTDDLPEPNLWMGLNGWEWLSFNKYVYPDIWFKDHFVVHFGDGHETISEILDKEFEVELLEPIFSEKAKQQASIYFWMLVSLLAGIFAVYGVYKFVVGLM